MDFDSQSQANGIAKSRVEPMQLVPIHNQFEECPARQDNETYPLSSTWQYSPDCPMLSSPHK